MARRRSAATKAIKDMMELGIDVSIRKNLYKYALVILLIAGAYFYGISIEKGKTREYYNSTESLLDTIASKYKDFNDVIVETDSYYQYEQSKENYNK